MALRLVVTIILTLLPIVLLLRYFYTRDVNREPRDVLVRTFIRGVLIVVPVFICSWIANSFWWTSWGSWNDALFVSFILAAIPEELCKLWVIAGYSSRQRCFDEPMDGLVYGATAALGFAALENILYVSSGGWGVALARAFTAVPMHAMTGAMLGYGIARVRFSRRGRGSILVGISAAILVHGGYNFFLLAANFGLENGVISLSAACGLIGCTGTLLLISVVWTVCTVRYLRREQRSSQITAKS